MATSKAKAKKVITIESKEDFDKMVSEAGNKHVLVEFFATWCGPCAVIGPHLEKIADEYEDCLVVLKVDVDDHTELAEQYDINSMPSFLIIKNKVTLEQFVGSNTEKVQTTLQKFCGKPTERASKSKPNKILSLIKTSKPEEGPPKQ